MQPISSRIRRLSFTQQNTTSDNTSHGGKPDQYALVEQFLNHLLSTLGLAPSDVFMVPGNHDIDREVQRLAFYGSRARFSTADDVERFLSLAEERQCLLNRLAAFNDFDARFSAALRRDFTDDRLAYISRRVVDDLPLGIVGLNSAIACGDEDDHGNIIVGDRPVVDITEKLRQADVRLVIGIVHHPPALLRPFDQLTFERRFLPLCDILHRGHLHEPGVQPIITFKGTNCLVVAAGAGYAWRQFENSYSIITLDAVAARCAVTNYEYENHSGTFNVGATSVHALRLRGALPGDVAALASALSALDDNTASASSPGSWLSVVSVFARL